MNVVQSHQTGQNHDLAARTYSAHVNLSKRGPEAQGEGAGPVRMGVAELEANGLAPSAYTVLVSRLENRGANDTTAVTDLAEWIDARLPRISDQARRRIVALPEYGAAGLKPEFDSLARQIADRLNKGGVTEAMLALLKHPVFAAYMKDQQVRIAMYGPRGLLRAS
jgi:hypothetical protein